MVTIHIFLSLNKFRHVREFYHIVLSDLKEYFSLRSILSIRHKLIIRSILSLISSLSSDLGLNSFESCFLVASLLSTGVDNEKVNKIENEPKTRISGLMIRINLQVASLVFLVVL